MSAEWGSDVLRLPALDAKVAAAMAEERIDRLTEDECPPMPCSHRNVYVEGPDESVGIFGWVRFCEDCETDLTQEEEDI